MNGWGSTSAWIGNFGSGESTISGSISLNGPLTLAGRIDVSGCITGEGRLATSTSSTWITLTGQNSFSGGVRLDGGTLLIGSDTALGSGTLWIGPTFGSSMGASGEPRAILNDVIPNTSGVVRFIGVLPLRFTAPVNLGGGEQRIQVSNTTTFAGPVFNGSIRKTGLGTLEMAWLRVPSASITEGLLRILPGSADGVANRLESLTITAGAAVDPSDSDLVLDYSNASLASNVKQYLRDGRLYSSSSIATTTTLGYAENALLGYTTFSGQSVDSTSLLIKYTFFGDANLDGTVNLRDLMMFASGWQTTGPWTSGDFNLDGIVNHIDLGLLARNWQAGGETLGPAVEELGLPPIPVPEPVAVAGLSVVMFVRRRNLHRKMGRIE